ncbi:hypothetical protein, partial, partial [Absidia glauca]
QDAEIENDRAANYRVLQVVTNLYDELTTLSGKATGQFCDT